MSEYLDLIQSSISRCFGELEAAYQKDIAQEMTEDEAETLEDHYTDEFIKTGHTFPQLLFSSFVVAWYSFVEQKLIDLCDELHLQIIVKPWDSESPSKGIDRARIFLRQARKYEIDKSYWDELQKIRQVRNFIVHRGTRIIGNLIQADNKWVALQTGRGSTVYFDINQALFEYMKKRRIVEHTNLYLDVMPSFKYCKDLVEFGEKLFRKLCADLELDQ